LFGTELSAIPAEVREQPDKRQYCSLTCGARTADRAANPLATVVADLNAELARSG
jgi:hypothetical protein